MSRHHLGYGIFIAVVVGLPAAVVSTPKVLPGAQSASIVGQIVDASGQPLPGVSVTTIAETGGVAGAISAGDGTFQFGTLSDGTYRVDFELLGFDLIRRNHVQVRRGTTAKAEAIMFVSATCECVNIVPSPPLRERSGQVVDESGRPLAHARLEVVSPIRREVAYADGEGRFKVRLPVNDLWPLTVSDGGFGAKTQQVSGTGAVSVLFKLARAGTTGAPEMQRFSRGCRCPGDLFTHDGR